MRLSRRGFLLQAALVAGARAAPLDARGVAAPQLFSCLRERTGAYALGAFDAAGEPVFTVALPARGHGVVLAPGAAAGVVLARRPGEYLLVFDPRTGAERVRVRAAPGRCLQGHGVFSGDGRYLFVTENDFAAGRGVIGVYDAGDDFRRVDEFASGGVGPHEIVRLPDGRHLAVANGGIHARPDGTLDPGRMRPSLCLIDTTSGAVIETATFDHHLRRASVRHLAVDPGGRIAIGLQYHGAKSDDVPLLALYDGRLQMLAATRSTWRTLRHYVGSVAFDVSGRYLAASSPRGGVAHVRDLIDGYAAPRQVALADVCGVATGKARGEFLFTSGGGVIARWSAPADAVVATCRFPGRAFDNHAGVPPVLDVARRGPPGFDVAPAL